MDLTIACDIHKWSPIEIQGAELMALPAGPNTYLAGDIIDLANVAKADLSSALIDRANLILKHKQHYDDGNHERSNLRYWPMISALSEQGKKAFIGHGDLEANPSKWYAYRKEAKGAGWFKRKFVVPFIAEWESIARGLQPDFIQRAVALAKANGCTHYICGHFHPPQRITQVIDGITIIVLPRGINKVTI